MKSFEETESLIASLVVDIGGSLDAYENDVPASAPAPQVNSFDAAVATIAAHTQDNDTSRRSAPVSVEEGLWEATGKTPATLIKEMGEISEQLGGLTTDPFEEPEEDYPTSEDEKAFFEEMNVPHPDDAEPDPEAPGTMFDGAFWGDVTNMVYLDEQPDPIEEGYVLFGPVSKSDELQEIYQAFKFAQQTGEPQTVTLDSGTYEMSPSRGCMGWELHDTGKERRYSQESVSQFYENVDEEDLFIWVLPDDRSEREDLGYIHNRWVFIPEE